ncbi:MAG TPA: hypothetical protein DHV14_08785 [Micrococcales bacterium]|uniref:restriction endonuclease subunit S n=1 Tax=Miniimonas arenae TaxID=676201 RepID=UPI000EDD884E|nr:restriction endonuclease subunit S [Miniimonas arenae]HCX85215.1 hypothetical protein [Micrococcales bacterium]
MKTAPLGDIAKIVSGATPKTGVAEYWDGEVQWATPADLSKLNGPYISETPRKLTAIGVRSCPTTVLPAGSVLLSSRAPIGHVAINTVPMATNQGFKSLVPGPDLDAKYLYHWLKSKTAYLQSLGNGATFKELSKKTTEQIAVPLPPLPEQRRIAAILDHADALRAKRRQVLAHLEALSESIFEDFFLQQPDGWARLSELAEKVVVGHVGPTSEFFRPTGVPFLRTGNVGHGEIVREGLAYVTTDFHQRLKKSQIRRGDVLISRVITDEVRAAIAPEDLDGANCANIIVVRPSDRLLPATVLGYLGRAETQRRLVGRRVGSAQGVVNTSVLKELSTPTYSVERQQHLTARVEEISAQRAAERRAIDAEEELFTSLRYRAFRGDL